MKKIYSLLILAGALFSSCSDFLDREPITSPNSATFLSSQNQVTNYVNGLYTSLPSLATYGMGVRGEEKNSDNILADNYDRRLNGELQETGGGAEAWQNGYKYLRNVNYFFKYYNIAEAEENDALRSLKGEVYFFRAYWHFYLLKNFGDIPVMDAFWDENATVAGLQMPPKDRSAVAQFILDDLETAKGLLYKRSEYQGLRVSKEAAIILAMRVALYEGTWEKYHKGTDFAAAEDKSGEFLGKVLTLGDELFGMGLSLNTSDNDPFIEKDVAKRSPGDSYAHLFNQSDLSGIPEAVFWKKYSIAGGLVHGLEGLLASGNVDNSGAAGLSQSLVDNYLDADGKFINPNDAKFQDFNETFANRDPRLLQTVMNNGCKFKSTAKGTKPMNIAEYKNGTDKESKDFNAAINPPYLLASGNQRCLTGYHIRLGIDSTYVEGDGETALTLIRYSEALLNYAEAAEELGKCDDAVLEKTLKPLRERAGVTYIKPTELDPNFTDFGYTLTPNLQEIRRERRSELALQGFRLDDLMRWRGHKLIVGQRGRGAYLGKESLLYKAFDPKEKRAELDKLITDNGRLDPLKERLPNGYQFDADRDYLLPIPTNELQLDKLLQQNPGWQKK